MAIEQIMPLLPAIINVIALVTTFIFFGSLDKDPQIKHLKTNIELAPKYKSRKTAAEPVGCALCAAGILW